MEKDVVYVKLGDWKRVQRESRIYQRLSDLDFVGCPRYYGMRHVDGQPHKRELLIEKMAASLDDNESSLVPFFPDDFKKTAAEHHYFAKNLPMKALATTAEFWDKAYQLALILASLHMRAGLCHRDIKPGNVCVDSKGYVCLIDYEMCGEIMQPPGDRLSANRKRRMNAEDWSDFYGTQIYAPPEMLRGDRKEYGGLPYGPECDSWSYGVTLLEMFSGVDFNSRRVVDEKRWSSPRSTSSA